MGLKRVAVIGAGASGIAQTKQLLDAFARPNAKDEVEVVVFESKDEVGGVWYSKGTPKPFLTSFTPPAGDSEAGPSQAYVYPPKDQDPSPMYEGLHTNLPCDLMAFRDFEFSDDTPAFPDRATVQQYLEEYADFFELRKHIRFRHSVTRLYHSPVRSSAPDNLPNSDATSSTRRWTIEFHNAEGSGGKEEFDFVCVANGHYADGWIPPIPGLETWKGEMLHSRFFRRAEDFAGKRVLVVGSYASGGDISRLIAGLNVGRYKPDGSPLHPAMNGHANGNEARNDEGGFTKVYVSASGPSPHSVDPHDPTSRWAPYITWLPLIDHLQAPSPGAPNGTIHLQGGKRLSEVDVILFATGYNYTYPFCKTTDEPWSSLPLLSGTIKPLEREGGGEEDVGGLKGLGMRGLDPLMMFMDGDRSITFPVLQYQLVPFPMAETQARLTAFLWAGLLDMPEDIDLPPNPNNPYSGHPAEVDGNGHVNEVSNGFEPKGGAQANGDAKKQPRKVFTQRQALVFGSPYEWTYQEYLMDLMKPVYESDEDVPEHWKSVEAWRRDRRADAGLRKKVLGY